MKRWLLILTVCIFTLMPCLSALAYTPQTVYTYDFYGNAVRLKEMYSVGRTITGESLGVGAFSSPQGLYVDTEGLIYICDSGNGRVLVLNNKYKLIREIKEFTRQDGTIDKLNYPTDVSLSSTGELYIADQRGLRIVAIDKNNNLHLEIADVKSDLLQTGFQFRPSKLVLDSTDRIYVVSSGVTNGIMELDRKGAVRRFIGAVPVKVTLTDYIWKMIATEEQYATMARSVPTEYSNITLSDEDFLFGTVSTVDGNTTKSAIEGSLYRVRGTRIVPETLSEWINRVIKLFNPSQEETAYTVKKLNLKGNDILHRNGYQVPVGDLQFYMGGDSSEYGSGKITTEIKASLTNMTDTAYISVNDLQGTVRGPSQFIDVAVHQSGVYSVLDQRRGRIFTYDSEGVLLYVFGGRGNAEGLFNMPTALCYLGDELLAIDAQKGSLTVFEPTSFVNDIYSAYETYLEGDYEGSLKYWNETITYCSNFDAGYIGAGRSLLRLERYEESMEMFKLAEYRDGYDKAFVLHRGQLIKNWFGYAAAAIVILVIAIIIIRKLLKRRGKPLITIKSPGVQRYFKTLGYAKYLSLRPFDGFYDLKYEKRGSVAAATTILLLNVVVAIISRQLTGFLFNVEAAWSLNIMSVFISVVLPVLLFVAANWCVTSLLEGEGSVKDIYLCICYAMFPMIFLNLIGVALSNVLAIREISFLTVVNGGATLWFGILLFFGIGVTQQYTIKRNILSLILTLVGMLIIIFIAMLFFTLIEKVYAFVLTLSNEIMLRN